ncbi:MAG: type I-E CRISPR-associated protein Cas7/Cse4/CasC, partial [Gallicola sp.]|nr:type I-E CRISPR-associated protein Cas7/Cse4/CasC [Gallicola sp.]
FANQTLPQIVLVTLRSDRPVNLVSAFENPVNSSSGYIQLSIDRLFEELQRVEKFVKKPQTLMYVSSHNIEYDYGSECANLMELLDAF